MDLRSYTNRTGMTKCTMFPAGTHVNNFRTGCIKCNPGYYSNKEGLLSCEPCPYNQFTNEIGSISCTPCPEGTYVNSLRTACIECPPGYYADKGLEKCIQWDEGTYSNLSGVSSCKTCENGKIVNYYGTSCINCPTTETQCESGYYKDDQCSIKACIICPSGRKIPNFWMIFFNY